MTERHEGSIIVPSAGPLDAEIAAVGEAPAWQEEKKGEPFVGASGVMLNKGLSKVALARQNVRLMNLVPKRAPSDKFKNFKQSDIDWGVARLFEELREMPELKLIIALGKNPLKHLTGIQAPVGRWRGSLLEPEKWPCVSTDIAPAFYGAELEWPVLVSRHPAAVNRQFKWIWDFMRDLSKAQRFVKGEWKGDVLDRKWFLNDFDALNDFVHDVIKNGHLVSVDTEMSPMHIMALALEDEVHSFVWDRKARPAVEALMGSENVLKVAHNWGHDWAFIKDAFGIDVKGPLFDTQGGHHLLDAEAPRSLSPDISTRYTYWPFHKWMFQIDPIVYCGMDASVCADAYWPMMEQLQHKDLMKVAQHDHKLLEVLLEMQWEGVKVDETQRFKEEKRQQKKLEETEKEVIRIAEPVIRKKLSKFKKPHLFYVKKQCNCCGGGSVAKKRCWRCAGFGDKPSKKELEEEFGNPEGLLKKELEEKVLKACKACGGEGKKGEWLDFEPVTKDQQVADVLYRGLGMKPRKYNGKETIRRERLEAVSEERRPEFLEEYLKLSSISSDFETLKRLQPGIDGKLHSVFDPWKATSGRVASSEGLVFPGTNMQNIPKEARRMIVPPEGFVFIYPDYAQIEGRCVAVLGSEEELLRIYASGGDSHTQIMELIYEKSGFDMNDISIGPHAGEGRFFTKKTMYAFSYGAREGLVAGELGVDLELAKEILQILSRTFPGVERYKRSVAEEMRLHRTVKSPTGRERFFQDRIYDKKTKKVQYEWLKKGWSFAPQDMAATVLAKGLIEFREEFPWIKQHVHVHDAGLLSAPEDRIEEAFHASKKAMEQEMWGMNFPADPSFGPNWFVASQSDVWKKENGFDNYVI